MNPYSGLVDLAEKKGLLNKSGNRLVYKSTAGEEILQYRKAWESNTDGCLDLLMKDFVDPVSKFEEDALDDNYEEDIAVVEEEIIE